MTREERKKALEVLRTYDMSEDNDDTEFKSAIALAIKALEQDAQTDVLDDIKAEIKRLRKNCVADNMACYYHAFGMALEVVYDAEAREYHRYVYGS